LAQATLRGWGPSSPEKKGTTPPNFWPMPIVAKQLDLWMYQDAT